MAFSWLNNMEIETHFFIFNIDEKQYKKWRDHFYCENHLVIYVD